MAQYDVPMMQENAAADFLQVNITPAASSLLGFTGTGDKTISNISLAANMAMTAGSLDIADTVTLGVASTTAGIIELYSTGAAHKTTLRAATTPTAAVVYYLPTADGSNGNVLKTDGSGNLAWTTNNSDSFKVKIDAAATEDYIGAAYSDGVLRTDQSISVTDGGDYITLAIDVHNIANATIQTNDLIPFSDESAAGDPTKTTTIDNLLIAMMNLVSAPATAGAAGTTGQIAFDTNYLYRCTNTNTWKRTPLATWS